MGGAEVMEQNARDNLEKQGRAASHPPPLSQVSRKIYAVDGPPDGSGIRNHIESFASRSGSDSVAGVGIPKGRPSMIATVQDRGATIRVTSRMRGYLGARGVHLRQSTKAVRIPARRFWRRAWAEAHEQQTQKMNTMRAHIAKR